MKPQICPKCGKETFFLVKRQKDDEYMCEDCYKEKHEVTNGNANNN